MLAVKLLYVNHNVAWSGGTFFRAHHLAVRMAQRGHDVTLLTTSRDAKLGFSHERRDGVLVVQAPDLLPGRARTGWDPWNTLRRIGLVGSGAWDLVHAFDCRPAVIVPALYARAAGAALVVDWADWWGRGGTTSERETSQLVRYLIGPLETFFEERFRALADGTTVISRALERRAIGLGVAPRSILLLRQGSDTDGITVADSAASRSAVGLDPTLRYLGHVGALFPRDRQLLVRTFDAICRARSDVRLLLMGNHGVPREHFARLHYVTDTGFVPTEELRAYTGACDAMLLPLSDTLANQARWPSKVNDYMAAGKPTVTTRVGDIAELIEQHGVGCATDADADALAQAAISLLDDPEQLRASACRAREVAETLLDWSQIARQLENHYDEVLGATQRARRRRAA